MFIDVIRHFRFSIQIHGDHMQISRVAAIVSPRQPSDGLIFGDQPTIGRPFFGAVTLTW